MNRSKIKQEIIGETEWSPSTVKVWYKISDGGAPTPTPGGSSSNLERAGWSRTRAKLLLAGRDKPTEHEST